MKITFCVVMDPISKIKIAKDSSFAMLLAAQAKGWQLRYLELSDLYLDQGVAKASVRPLQVRDDASGWFTLGERSDIDLGALDVIVMRKDPPVDQAFLMATHVLSAAERQGAFVVNRPQALRDCNEKLFATEFPDCCPPLLVSSDPARLRAFHAQHQDVVMKPLDGMGGESIFRVRDGDFNLGVIIETLTNNGTRLTMVQRYLPEIVSGDKRILLIDGEPVPYALARIPKVGENRGNLAAGGRGEARPLSERDRWICAQVGPHLRERGLLFVGVDVIGDYLTEINVTSPTCIRELDAQCGLNIAGQLMDVIARKLAARRATA